MWWQAAERAIEAENSESLGSIRFRVLMSGNMRIAHESTVQWLERAVGLSRRRHDPAAQISPCKWTLELTGTTEHPDAPGDRFRPVNLGNAWLQLCRRNEPTTVNAGPTQ